VNKYANYANTGAAIRAKSGTEPGIHILLANYQTGFTYEWLVRNRILPGRVYECTETIHSSITRKVCDVDLIKSSTVINAL